MTGLLAIGRGIKTTVCTAAVVGINVFSFSGTNRRFPPHPRHTTTIPVHLFLLAVTDFVLVHRVRLRSLFHRTISVHGPNTNRVVITVHTRQRSKQDTARGSTVRKRFMVRSAVFDSTQTTVPNSTQQTVPNKHYPTNTTPHPQQHIYTYLHDVINCGLCRLHATAVDSWACPTSSVGFVRACRLPARLELSQT